MRRVLLVEWDDDQSGFPEVTELSEVRHVEEGDGLRDRVVPFGGGRWVIARKVGKPPVEPVGSQ